MHTFVKNVADKEVNTLKKFYSEQIVLITLILFFTGCVYWICPWHNGNYLRSKSLLFTEQPWLYLDKQDILHVCILVPIIMRRGALPRVVYQDHTRNLDLLLVHDSPRPLPWTPRLFPPYKKGVVRRQLPGPNRAGLVTSRSDARRISDDLNVTRNTTKTPTEETFTVGVP